MAVPFESLTVLHAFVHHTVCAPDAAQLLRVDGRAVHETVTRRALLERALAWASVFRVRAIGRGERILLALPDGPELAACLLGIWMVGATAIPQSPGVAPTPSFLAVAAPHLVVAPAHDSIPGWVCTTPADLPTYHADFMLDDIPQLGPDDIAVVQFASGPTLRPLGAMLSHGALYANVAALAAAVGAGPDDRALSWSPLGLDMGLVGGLLMSLQIGYPLALMRPEAFLVSPVRWLEAIDAHRATISAAPTFAYALCVRRVRPERVAKLDLSTWRVALVGAETVHAHVLRDFANLLAPAGFDPRALTPAYGLAEATLAVTVAPRGQGLSTCTRGGAELVRLGPPVAGTELAIVDDAGDSLPPGVIGHVLMRGPGVMHGYLGDAPRTAATLRAGWLHTGDLGLVDDGQLVLVGRSKELVIRRGKNVWVEDIEALLAEVPGLHEARVFASARTERDEATEGLVILAEAADRPGDADDLVHRIGTLMLDRLALRPSHVAALPADTLPRRADGALDRPACRRLAERIA